MTGIIVPTAGDVHVNRPLTNISVAMLQSAEGFVANRVFPSIPVSHQSDTYFEYPRGEFNRDEMRERAPGTESAGGSYDIDEALPYFCRVYAYHKDIPDQIRANQDSPLNLDREATVYVTHKGLLRREINFRTNFFKASVWSTDITGVGGPSIGAGQALQWNDDASDPIRNIRTGQTYVQSQTGFRPNVLTISRPVYDVLVDHPDFVARMDRGQTSGAAKVNREAMAALFELDEVVVMDAIENTAKKGASAVHGFIGGKHALLTYRPPSPGLMTPSAGYTFDWTGFSPAGIRIKKFRRAEEFESDRVEAQQAFDQKVIAADLGYFFSGIVA